VQICEIRGKIAGIFFPPPQLKKMISKNLIPNLDAATIQRLKTDGGVFLIDKPLHWTSFDVVNKLRYLLKKKTGDKNLKVGHAGTLDPLATGLLIVCVGKMTKQIDSFMDTTKGYAGTLVLGATRPSYDMETEIDQTFPTEHLNETLFETARQSFLGEIQQYPPIFSAIKVGGRPLYESARLGIAVKVEPRKVRIDRFDLQFIEQNTLSFEITCSKGTYIRSMAYDFGKACGSGAYLSSLQRTASGDFQLKDAWTMDTLIQQLETL
jgi:tRNA pseudouridine55 synthase